jgi:hypothetical protein
MDGCLWLLEYLCASQHVTFPLLNAECPNHAALPGARSRVHLADLLTHLTPWHQVSLRAVSSSCLLPSDPTTLSTPNHRSRQGSESKLFDWRVLCVCVHCLVAQRAASPTDGGDDVLYTELSHLTQTGQSGSKDGVSGGKRLAICLSNLRPGFSEVGR